MAHLRRSKVSLDYNYFNRPVCNLVNNSRRPTCKGLVSVLSFVGHLVILSRSFRRPRRVKKDCSREDPL